MMKNKVLLFGLGLCLLSGPVLAASTQDLQSLIMLGLRGNLGLKAGRFSVLSAREDVTAAAGAFDVELYANGNLQRQKTPNSSNLIPQEYFDVEALLSEVGLRKRFATGLNATLFANSSRLKDSSAVESLDPKYQSSLGLSLDQPLLRNGGAAVNRLDLSIAERERSRSDLVFLQRAQNLALGVEVGYYDLLNARLEEFFRQDALELTRVLLQGNRRKLESGLIPVSEVQQAETALAGRELDYVVARQQRELRVHQLNGLLNNLLPENLSAAGEDGRPPQGLVRPGQAFVPVFADAFDNARHSRPDLQIAAVAIDEGRLREEAARNRQRPQLDLHLEFQANGLSGEERSSASIPYAGAWNDSFASMASADGYLWGAGLQFSYPLGNRSARSGYKKARLQSARERTNRRELLLQVETELRERLTQVQRLGELVEVSSRFQDLAEISYRQENRRLEEGLSDTFRVLDFQEKMISAKINHIAALIEYNKGLASLSYAMGSNLLRHGIVADLSGEEIRFDEN